TGLFLFHEGRFVQQAIHDGEPFDKQMAQAHAGTYRSDDTGVHLVAELGIIVRPEEDPPLSLGSRGSHHVVPKRSGDTLTLTFSTGTVQKLERVGGGRGRIFKLEGGLLALVNGSFLLVASLPERTVAGSGTYERQAASLELDAARWFSLRQGRVSYVRHRALQATFDERTLMLEDGTTFRVSN
ncbi:MAG: hypothetical protein ACE5JI_12415, partial [Acidobacteriota bacterium]